MTTERSLVLVKPDGFARGLTGEVLRRIEAKGYRLLALQVLTPDLDRLHSHYAEHEGKPFYRPLVDFMLSGPVVAIVLEGERCIEGFRALGAASIDHKRSAVRIISRRGVVAADDADENREP